jgi:hypothetical protein
VVGFNPFRPSSKTALDVALVTGTIVVIAGLLVWAIWG